ncbi:MAG: UDP-glucose 4-epimerase GalE [Flavobacteriaceae bacterium]|nr:UDP-glucose 4-epimerase GalE [Flavobacteriaceae bacterium]
MNILITGGLGYIGSHVVLCLANKGYNIIIVDNLSNCDISVLENLNQLTNSKLAFEKLDLSVRDQVESFFKNYSNIDGVIHFAALKSVGESVRKPKKYYDNNLYSMLNIIEFMPKAIPFVFSSSCTVYGSVSNQPITESTPHGIAESPYGKTKQICEKIMDKEFHGIKDFKGLSLRYFNPLGAHSSGLIGENPKNTPENLLPYLTQVVSGKREVLTVYGDDYNTRDGTCIRDYIHIIDLAEAHLKAIEYLFKIQDKNFIDYINIGTGSGVSVLELIQTFEKSTGLKVNYKIGKRRPGDIEVAYAETKKAEQILRWKPKYSLSSALNSAWNWENKSLD